MILCIETSDAEISKIKRHKTFGTRLYLSNNSACKSLCNFYEKLEMINLFCTLSTININADMMIRHNPFRFAITFVVGAV